MIELIAAAGFFIGFHLIVAGTPLRALIVRTIGERVYLGLFSLVSIAGIVWLGSAYSRAGYLETWGQLLSLKWAAVALMLVAALLVVIGLTTPSPTVVGAERLLERDEPAKGIVRITRHPFLWGVAVWAIVHLAVNGDFGSLILFGLLLVLALAGTVSIDAKRRRAAGESWARFAAVTSNIPFAALAAKRNRFDLAGIGWWRPIAAVLVWLALLHFHQTLFGVSPLPF